MVYIGYFKDINNVPYTVEIYTSEGGNSQYEITLADDPVVITQTSDSLFSPIKSISCTINIVSDGGLFDLYTLDPQGVKVVVYNRTSGDVIFRGYATPLQYSQDWTTYDTLALECVDCVSSLKEIKYQPINTSKAYQSVYSIIRSCFIHAFPDSEDSIFRWFRWYWPQNNIKAANSYTFSTTNNMIQNISLNEANFFDDDDEQTPWSYWEVLEEICKFFNVSLVCNEGKYWFIDYLYVATDSPTSYSFWQYDLDGNTTTSAFIKTATLDLNNYSGGTSTISTDDTYNVVSVDTNRYDISEIAQDTMDENYHVSITKEKEFATNGGIVSVYTNTTTHFWWWIDDEVVTKNIYKKYCRLAGMLNTDPEPIPNWSHVWTSPRTLATVPSYYNTQLNSLSNFINLPENKYINTMGATFLHYAVVDGELAKPTKLGWNDVIMFQVMTDTIKPASTNTTGVFKPKDIDDGVFEVPALIYNDDHEMNYSPHDGTSWLNINAKLWYQANWNSSTDPHWTGKKTLTITDTKELTQCMYPMDEVTDYPAHTFYYEIENSNTGNTTILNPRRLSGADGYGTGFQLLKCKLQIGDKYWNGSAWTTTDSTFYLNFNYEVDERTAGQGTSERHFESFAHLAWLNMVNNTTYEDSVGADGYCIPIEPTDCVCGKLILTIYTPRLYPAGYTACTSSTYANPNIAWYEWCPIVFMKDFKVDYIYTSDEEWYLSEEIDTDDIKYTNDTTYNYKYEKNDVLKINTWQEQRPISKSFPIVRFTNGNTPVCEYLNTTRDATKYNTSAKQEDIIIDRQLRHYSEPRKIFTCHRNQWINPWLRYTMNDALEIDGYYVVGSQNWSVRNRNNTVEFIEFGDKQIYTSN